jgi:HPt (histidine-containing phosphotransfer) domain-containing protein
LVGIFPFDRDIWGAEKEGVAMKAEIRQYIVEELELDDEETIVMLLDSYTESLNKNLELLRESLQAGNITEAVGVAHAMKGASANIGAQPFFEVCRAIELVLKSGDVATGKKLLGDLLAMHEAFLREAL